jgi:polyisoprenoid-binding protein YceI
MTPLKWPALAIVLLAAAACRGVPPAAPPAAAATASAAADANAHRYRIDGAHSTIRVLVYRGGPMASLGHNHVIVHHGLEGWVAPGAGGSVDGGAFHLQFAPAGFDVDAAPDRAAAGADFAAEVPPEARAGTLHNLLGESQLDAAHHPVVTVDSVTIEGRPPAQSATLDVGIAGHTARLSVPYTLERGAGRLRATAAFELRLTALGITPFSVFLGALRVEDQMQVAVDLVAVEEPAGPSCPSAKTAGSECPRAP